MKRHIIQLFIEGKWGFLRTTVTFQAGTVFAYVGAVSRQG